MAEHAAHHDAGHGSAMDYAEHEHTYALFIRLLKWGIGIVVAILVLMAIFLV